MQPIAIKELTIDDVIIRSPLHNQTAEEQAAAILQTFNSNINPRDSCFSYNPLPGRALPRVDISYFLLGHRNQVAELADPAGRRIALCFPTDPTSTIKSLGSVKKTAAFFGAYGKYVLNVPAGYYAKAFSKNNPVLYGEGPHVILDPTFRFEERDGFISQIQPYIQHSTLNVIRLPAGKVARVWIGTEPAILESRREPYIYFDPQFRLISRDPQNLFENATEQFLEHGSIKRIIPHTGEVAITYNNGQLQIIPPSLDNKPVIINSPTHNFNGFISTALQTCLFPSEDSKKQHLKDNPRGTADERNLKVLQTRDSLRVGVQLVVAFKIKQPELAITRLGKDGILPHIENIAFADMGKAVQASTMQEVMYFTQNKPKSKSALTIEEGLQTIQDQVKQNLANDLEDDGIELTRLNIETIKVLDEEIAKKLAGQSVTSAEFTTKQATLVKEYDIKTTEARLRAETDNIALQQQNQAIILQAQAKLDAAKREAEASLIAAEAQRKAAELKGELYQKYPQLLELELTRIKAEALKGATIYITPQDMGGFFNSPVALFNMMTNEKRAPQ